MPGAKPRATDLNRALELYQLRPPAGDWFAGKGRCEKVLPDERPEDAEGMVERNYLTRRFIARYCTHCTVKLDCTLDMLQQIGPPDGGQVRGGLASPDGTRLWLATTALRREGLEGAAARYKIPLDSVTRPAEPAVPPAASPTPLDSQTLPPPATPPPPETQG